MPIRTTTILILNFITTILILIHLTPSLSPASPPLTLVEVSAVAPIVCICETSGTTIRVPMKSHLSPA